MLNKLLNKIRRLLRLDNELDSLNSLNHKLQAQIEQITAEVTVIKHFIIGASGDITKSKILHDQIDQSLSQFKRAIPKAFEEYEIDLRDLDPKIYPIYKRLFENGKRAYESTKEGNFSHWDNIYSNLFTKFVFKYITGNVLDIGCGTNYKPVYLSGYPDEKISAIEPLELNYQAQFEVVRGFTEFLPWAENSFSTVIAATSFDHVLSLNVSLEQIKRVLKPNGLFILWIASMKDSKPYDPTNELFNAEDEFHLFHFDSKWLEPLFDNYQFHIADKAIIPQPGFDHVFYCLQSKK